MRASPSCCAHQVVCPGKEEVAGFRTGHAKSDDRIFAGCAARLPGVTIAVLPAVTVILSSRLWRTVLKFAHMARATDRAGRGLSRGLSSLGHEGPSGCRRRDCHSCCSEAFARGRAVCRGGRPCCRRAAPMWVRFAPAARLATITCHGAREPHHARTARLWSLAFKRLHLPQAGLPVGHCHNLW
jgi:hypothetical protein